MTLYQIDAGYFKLDGGAMFGVVPKTFWNRWNPADENNLTSWMMRCLLIEDGKRLILVDTGMGDKQDAKWQGFYYRHGNGELVKSIRAAGFSENDVTDVILSHLHFDHCGGAVKWNNDKTGFQLTFPNAHYWTHSDHFAWATVNPNLREKASFFTNNIMPIQEAGHMKFIDKEVNPFSNIEFLTADGHTEKMIMPKITYKDKTLVFLADTIPSHAHIPIPYVMSYDMRPLQTMIEKELILDEAAAKNWILYFDHDPLVDCATVQKTEKGYQVHHKGALAEFL